MNKYTLFGPIALLLGFALLFSCDSPDDEDNKGPLPSVLHLLQTYTTQYAKYQKGKEYKSAEWDGNVLTRYNAG